jgi:hypothetical protein
VVIKKIKGKIGGIEIQLSETYESIIISKKKNIIISKSNVLFIKKKKTSNKLKLSLYMIMYLEEHYN